MSLYYSQFSVDQRWWPCYSSVVMSRQRFGRVVTAFCTWTELLYVEPSSYTDGRLFAGIPSCYVSSHSGQLSLLASVGRKMTTAKGQWQCCSDGKVSVGRLSHWPCITDSMVYPSIYELSTDRQADLYHAYTHRLGFVPCTFCTSVSPANSNNLEQIIQQNRASYF